MFIAALADPTAMRPILLLPKANLDGSSTNEADDEMFE